MKWNFVPRTVVAILFALTAVTMLPSAYADQCSLAGAAGQYGFSDSGMVLGIGPRVAVASLIFDTAGNISGPVTANLNGTVSQTTLAGRYTVNPDCTGTASFSEFDQMGHVIITATVAFVWDDDMKQLHFIFTSAKLANGTTLPTVINGEARKQHSEG